MASLAHLDKDGDGDIDSSEWAAGYAQLGKQAPGVPNPAVWYGTLPGGPSFSISQISMTEMYKAPSQLIDHPEFRNERSGVMVGYAGHVPRARDKVGGSPQGNIPGTPVSPNGAVGIDMEAMMSGKFKRSLPASRVKTFAQHPTGAVQYTSEALDEYKVRSLEEKNVPGDESQGQVKPALYGEGIIPGYGGHKFGAKFSYGSTIYSNGQGGDPVPKTDGAHDEWSGRNVASTGHGASSIAGGTYENAWEAKKSLVAYGDGKKGPERKYLLADGRLTDGTRDD